MLKKLAGLWAPGAYQGKRRMRGYFEGWYYKMVDAAGRNSVAVIPGVSFDSAGNASAFIQLLDAATTVSGYFRYEIGQFHASSRTFELSIGPNSFSGSGLSVDAAQDGNSLKGTLVFNAITPWPVRPLAPGAMGWYAFVPFMECYHAVLSFDHPIEGELEINGRRTDFSGGRGYMEKDWGSSFPRYHVWLQSNHFDIPGTSLMVSIANIPWMGSYFDGFIAGFQHMGRLYRFATYTGAKLSLFRLEEQKLSVHIESRRLRLELEVNEEGGVPLRAPVMGDMRATLLESQSAVVRLRLVRTERGAEETVFAGSGRHGGFEVAGDRAELAAIETAER